MTKLLALWPSSPMVAQEMIYAPSKAWADLVITEMSMFPMGKHDDLTYGAAQALKYICDIGFAQTDDEAREAKNRAMNASVASKKSVSHARLKALNVATRRKCRPETQCPERARVLAWRIRSRYWSLKNYYFCSHTAHVVCYFCYYQRIFDQ